MSSFKTTDKKIMKRALKLANDSLIIKDYPVGAVLIINGKVVAESRNNLHNLKNWSGHAESSLILKNSKLIKNEKLNKKSKIELFSTLEPCLMCLGCAVMNRVSRIVYACPDPRGGATKLTTKNLPSFYKDN
jgi:tRNA(adenine34) deaminase